MGYKIVSIRAGVPDWFPEQPSIRGQKWYCIAYQGYDRVGNPTYNFRHWVKARNKVEAKARGMEEVKKLNSRDKGFTFTHTMTAAGRSKKAKAAAESKKRISKSQVFSEE